MEKQRMLQENKEAIRELVFLQMTLRVNEKKLKDYIRVLKTYKAENKQLQAENKELKDTVSQQRLWLIDLESNSFKEIETLKKEVVSSLINGEAKQ
jgi:regulator of replication initiation timing